MLVNLNSLKIYQPQQNKVRQASYPNLAPLKQDTISFKAKFVRPKDLMDLPPKDIIDICVKAIKNGSEIGRGQEATVHKIDAYAREYCVRQERNTPGSLDKLNLSFNLDKYDKANFVVAKLGEGITIMRYITGVPIKIMRNSDTTSGIKVKESLQELVANNFPEESFVKVLKQIETNRKNGIIFDRKGENLLVDPMVQELTAIDFSPKFNDIEYNPIAYIYHALDVDSTEHAPKVLGKLCQAYAERLKTSPLKNLNLNVLDKNFYHRGFMDDAFNNFPDKNLLEEVRTKLFDDLLNAKTKLSKKQFCSKVDEFKEYAEEKLINYTPPRYEYY